MERKPPRVPHQLGVLPEGKLVQTGMGQQEFQVNAVGEHFLAAAVLVFQAEEHVKILAVRILRGFQIGIVVTVHLLLPGQGGIHSRVAPEEVVGDDHTGVPFFIIGTGHFHRGAVGAFAAPAGMAVQFIAIGISVCRSHGFRLLMDDKILKRRKAAAG